jgi:hypothetical protein
MNLLFGFVSALISLGCLLLLFLIRAPDPSVNYTKSYMGYSSFGAVFFFVLALFMFYRHWRYEDDGDQTEGEMV